MFELDTAALLDDDNDDHNVEEDEEDPGRLVSDEAEATAEEWVKVKEEGQVGEGGSLLDATGRRCCISLDL